MSAPILASSTGDKGCFTDTAAAPFGLLLDDHDISVPAPGCGTRRVFGAGWVIRVEASTLSWLQSSSRFLMSSLLSASLTSAAALVSAAGISGSSVGGVCALAAATRIMLTLAASISGQPQPPHLFEIIARPSPSSTRAIYGTT